MEIPTLHKRKILKLNMLSAEARNIFWQPTRYRIISRHSDFSYSRLSISCLRHSQFFFYFDKHGGQSEKSSRKSTELETWRLTSNLAKIHPKIGLSSIHHNISGFALKSFNDCL